MTENNFNFTNGVSYDVWYEQKRLINQLKKENDRYRKALEPFQDEYFKGLDTTTIAELAKKSIRLTTENRNLETALEEIEWIALRGLNPICYKSNCSRCQCYNGDDCKARMNALINNYFTKNGEFFDGNGDFVEAMEGLLDEERSSCNRAKPISQQILDIIADLRTDETKCNPDSEQIEHTAAKTQMRNSGSVEQIQDSKAKGEGNNAG